MTRLLATAACLLTATGCTLMPEALQPHQLWKLNRQSPSGRDDAYFSISERPAPRSTSFFSKTSDAETAEAMADPFADLD